MLGKFPLNDQTAAAFRDRIARLTPDTPRRWGTMSSTAMLAHLRHAFDMSLGLVPVTDDSNWFTRNVIFPVVFKLLAPPRNIKVPAKYLPAGSEDFEAERQGAIEGMAKFLEALRDTPARIAINPGFGPLTLRDWALIHGKHVDHHLRQFGV